MASAFEETIANSKLREQKAEKIKNITAVTVVLLSPRPVTDAPYRMQARQKHINVSAQVILMRGFIVSILLDPPIKFVKTVIALMPELLMLINSKSAAQLSSHPGSGFAAK